MQTWLRDNSHWQYGYDPLGQVILGDKYWADQTPVAERHGRRPIASNVSCIQNPQRQRR